MNPKPINLRDIKKMRLERHWLQDRLAEMSGLNIRTIQRIENGKNAGLESLKPLLLILIKKKNWNRLEKKKNMFRVL